MSRLSYRRFCRPSVTGVWKICSEQAQHKARTIISHAVFDEDVLQRFEKNPSTNTRAVGDAVDVERCTRAKAASSPSAKRCRLC